MLVVRLGQFVVPAVASRGQLRVRGECGGIDPVAHRQIQSDLLEAASPLTPAESSIAGQYTAWNRMIPLPMT